MHPNASEFPQWSGYGECLKICNLVKENGGQAYLVGGCVRDSLLGKIPKDIDMEVFHISTQKLEKILNQHYEWFHVGRSFGVYKFRNLSIDLSIPRTEIKTGDSHQDFTITLDPNLPLDKASLRRDFTINSIYWEPLNNLIFDPNNGVADLNQKRLKHCSEKFSEDPLRVLRGAQFIARFGLVPDHETIQICQKCSIENLSKERIQEEFQKLILQGNQISKGLEFLRETNWLRFFPELNDLINCPQDPKWHPEGDVWQHTKHCMDAFARRRIGNQEEDWIVGIAVLCHDLGKVNTTVIHPNGRISSQRHEQTGIPLAQALINRISVEKSLFEEIAPLVRYHMSPPIFHKDKSGPKAIRKLAVKVGRLDRLTRVSLADQEGRPPLLADIDAAGEWLLNQAQKLNIADKRPQPLIKGRDLIEIGFQPGPSFKNTLDSCFSAQLDGEFNTIIEARDWLIRNESSLPR